MKPFDPNKDKRWRTPWYGGVTLSLVSIFVLASMLVVWNKFPEEKTTPDDLIVYCAAGIRKPVEEAVKAYQDEFGVKIALDYDSSGALEGKLQLDVDSNKSRADLYIPADLSFANRAMQKGLTKESIQLASFNLVLASNPNANLKFTTLDEFLDLDAPFVICNEAAGVGKTTKAVLENLGEWDTFNAAKKASSPRVTDAAAAIAASKVVQAGFLWNTTAKQFGLKIHEIPAFKLIRSKITANVCSSSLKARQALLFARYLAAPSKGQIYFAKHNFTGVDGDKWEENPELIVYCGGVNREAVTETLRDFERREGCKIVEQFAGCGSLVANIKAIGMSKAKTAMPDAFLTCDASYMNKVETLYQDARDVSSTDIVMLIRKGNPKNLRTLEDLGREDLSIGTTDKKISTLGDLSWQLLAKAGIAEKIKANDTWEVTTPTAHELILQMEGHTKLDVALVYLANCQNLSKGLFETVPIHDPLAQATQNIAIHKSSSFPDMAGRLVEAITSIRSKERFLDAGFRWKAKDANAN